MEPERRETHTHIEHERSGGSGIAFIVGGMVVAVLVLAVMVWGGPFGTWPGDDADIEVSTQTEVPGAIEEVERGMTAEEPAGADVDVNIGSTPAPSEPAAPAPQSEN